MALNVGTLEAQLRLNSGTYDRDLARARNGFENLEARVRAVERSTSGVGTSARAMGSDVNRASRQADDSLRGVGRGADNARQSVDQLGRSGSRVGSDIQRGVNSGGNPFAGLRQRASEAGAGAGEGIAGALPGPIGAAVGKAGPVGMAIMAVAAVGIMAGKALADNIAKGMQLQEQAAFAQAKFGWTDAQAAEAGKAAGAAYVNNFGESVDDNRGAIGAAIQSGLIDGTASAEAMQPVVERLQLVAKLMGEDVPAVARSAGQAVRNGLAKDSTEAFDLLIAGQQNSLNVSGDLLDSFDEYSTQLRALGLEGKEGWALVAQGVKGGARDTDVVIDALKEFKLRATDGTAAAAKGFEALKIPADQFSAAMNAGGQASRDMMATALRNLNAIKDPAEKNAAALALFGTKFEDIQGAAFALNLDTAVNEFGKVAGAGDRAAQVLDTPASRLATAKRSIEQSADTVRVKLAEAFGPSVGEAAKWVSDNIDLIAGTLKAVAGNAAAFGGAAITAFGGALWAVGKVTEAIAGMIEAFIRSQAVMGGLIAKIPGLGDVGRGIQDAANKAADFAGKFREGGAAAAELGGKMTTAGAKVTAAGINLAFSKTEAEKTTDAFGRLGVKVEQTPDGKFIQVTDNSPEAIAKLETLGLKVRTLPDGKVVIDAQDEAAKAKIAAIVKTEEKLVELRVRSIPAESVGRTIGMQADGGIVAMADGGMRQIAKPQTAGIYAGRGAGTIFAEEETGGEAYIPLASGKRGRSTAILGEVARLFGMTLVGPTQSFAEGGLRTAAAINDFPRSGGLEGSPYKWGGVNWGDCSGAMSAIANFAVGLAPFASRFATASEGAELAKRGFKTGRGPAGSLRFGWVNGGPGGGHTAGTLPDGTNVEMGGARGNGQVGGKAAGADDPQFSNQAYLMLGDSGTTGDSGATTGSPTSGGSSAEEDGKKTTPSGDGQRVYVTGGRLDSIGTGSTSNSSPGVSFSLFANGGIEDHTAHITDKLRVFGEPETGGEAYIPLSPAKRARSLAIWQQTGKRLGVNAFAAGGIAAPKIEAPKIDVKAPVLGPGMALPIADGTGAGAGAPQLADSQAPATTFDGAKYTQERLTKLGVDMLGIAKDAAIQTLVPGGALPSILTNSVGLAKSIGDGLQSSQQNQRTETASSGSQNGGNQVVNNVTINATNTDDAFRQWQTKQNRDAAAFEGKLP